MNLRRTKFFRFTLMRYLCRISLFINNLHGSQELYDSSYASYLTRNVSVETFLASPLYDNISSTKNAWWSWHAMSAGFVRVLSYWKCFGCVTWYIFVLCVMRSRTVYLPPSFTRTRYGPVHNVWSRVLGWVRGRARTWDPMSNSVILSATFALCIESDSSKFCCAIRISVCCCASILLDECVIVSCVRFVPSYTFVEAYRVSVYQLCWWYFHSIIYVCI